MIENGGRTAPGPATEQRDDEIREGIRRGDPVAFSALDLLCRDVVRQTCIRVLGRSEDVEDAVQDAFVRALVALRREDRHIVLVPWMTTVARNTAIDQYRRSSRMRWAPLDELEDTVGDAAAETVVVGDVPRLDAAIGLLPPLYAEVLRLRGIEELSHFEIAARLGSTPSKVKALLHRARRAAASAWEKSDDAA